MTMKKLDLEEKQRLNSLLKKGGILIGVGLAYLVFVMITSWRIPCIFYLIGGKYCPGCGITRMCVALARLDIRAAVSHNLLAFCLAPVLLVILLCKAVTYVKQGSWGKRRSKAETVFYILAFVLCVIFTVMRNLPAYTWLAP